MRGWLIEARKAKGMTYKALGDATGMTESAVFNIEHGRRKTHGMDVDMVIKFAKALGFSPMTVIRMEMEWLNGRSKESI